MRIGIDATPLLGSLTGIGTYTHHLVRSLRDGWPDDTLVATAFSWRGRDALASAVPDEVEVASRPAPARALRSAWSYGERPPVEALCGPVDVFHATNFVLPPTRRAVGVLTVHDLAYLRFPETVSAASAAYRRLVPRGLLRADVVLTPSAAVAGQLHDAYTLDETPVVVTPLGVDEPWFATPPPEAGWLRERGIRGPYVLAVGTVEPRKNLAALIGAYALLAARDADAPDLVIVGGAGWGTVLEVSGVDPDRVVLTGYLRSDELRSVVAGASVLAFPSRDEGFGIPPLDAMACGVPVVANDLPVTREVLGGLAVFCDADDPEALATALARVLADPPSEAGRTALRAHAATYTWRRCAELTRAAYAEALARRSSRRP